MRIDVQVISNDIIKPSIPTPNHLSSYQFSFLDQWHCPVDIPLIYFFNLEKQLSKDYISSLLKTSLSKVLTHYYPIAGRVKDKYVACNDEGVLFLEAQVSCRLSHVLQEPYPVELNQLLADHATDECLAIQVNFFECGNFAIGASISHKIADGSSLITFINNWAAVARGDTRAFFTDFGNAKLFPPIDFEGFDRIFRNPEKSNVVMKRFVFDGSVITTLREKYASKLSSDQIYPTRVEALSSFIWSRFQASNDTRIGSQKTLSLNHGVNLRKRMIPQLPDDSFGNLSGVAIAISSEPTADEECVKKLRDSISNINANYIRKLQDGWSWLNDFTRMVGDANKGEILSFSYTSLCRFPVYEVDFGWGRPEWVAWGGIPLQNYSVLVDTKSGDGIEAWIRFTEEDMAKFEADRQLLDCLSSPQPDNKQAPHK